MTHRVHELQSTPVKTGDRARIIGDGDGAEGVVGIVGTVFPSGRCTVHLPDGGFRNLSAACLEKVD